MARWDNGEIKWVVAPDTTTTDFADTHMEAYNVRNGWIVFYVYYAKGAEGYLELQLYFENSNRVQLGEENWHALSSDGYWPAEGNLPAPEATYVGVRPMPWRFTASGRYRMVVPALPREDAIRIAARMDTEVGVGGSFHVRYVTDEISWGGVGQGDE